MGAPGRKHGGAAPTSIPPFTLSELKKTIPPHCFKRSLFRSLSYLVYDICMISTLYYLATACIPMLPYPFPYLAWPLYWILQGCAFMGLWFLGHECGHHGFSEYHILNDVIGFLIHASFLTPYFSWKFSHRRHHSNTGSLERDEVHVPRRKSELHPSAKYLNNPLGRAVTLVVKLTLGWYIYISVNGAGRPYGRFANHFDPRSPIFSENERLYIFLSDIGILVTAYLLYNLGLAQGFAWLFCVYGGPSMVMNAFIVIVTYLQHTHPSVPHYDEVEWDWLRGALTTIDRDYGILNAVFHRVTDAHVVHHLFSTIPHYHALEATRAIKPILGEYYQCDKTPIFKALWRETKKCIFVEERDQKKGIFWFSDKL